MKKPFLILMLLGFASCSRQEPQDLQNVSEPEEPVFTLAGDPKPVVISEIKASPSLYTAAGPARNTNLIEVSIDGESNTDAMRKIDAQALAEIFRLTLAQEGLKVSEIEKLLGTRDAEEKSARWENAVRLTYLLSGGRWLDVSEAKGQVLEVILVHGKKRELIYKQ